MIYSRVICGITEDTHTSHIVRAALEAVSFQTRDIIEAMSKDCGFFLTELQVIKMFIKYKLSTISCRFIMQQVYYYACIYYNFKRKCYEKKYLFFK